MVEEPMPYFHDELSGKVIGMAIEVHSALGPGLLESAYQRCLQYELQEAGLVVKSEVSLPIEYKGLLLQQAYRLDLLVNDELVVEIKHVEQINDLHTAQLLTYLKFGSYKRGLILNFNVKALKEGGIKRVIR